MSDRVRTTPLLILAGGFALLVLLMSHWKGLRSLIGMAFTSGINVGRDHITTTVNTLVLACVGAALPLLLLFTRTDQLLC